MALRFLMERRVQMNKWSLYASTLVGIYLLYELSGQFYGLEWVFALLTVGLFALFLRGWKRSGANGVALAFITAITLLTINSIFYLLAPPIFTFVFTIVLGLTLIPLFNSYRDAISTAWIFVLLNLLINIGFENDKTTVITLFITGTGALVGYYFQFLLLKKCFTFFFFLLAFITLLMNIFAGAILNSLFIGLFVILFAVLAYRFSMKNV